MAKKRRQVLKDGKRNENDAYLTNVGLHLEEEEYLEAEEE